MDIEEIKKLSNTGERVIPGDLSSKPIFLSHLKVYEFSTKYINKDIAVLDIGCGEGYGTSLLSKSAKLGIGIDYSNYIIKHARKKYGNEKCCLFLSMDATNLAFKYNFFDIIIALQVIEHIKNVDKFLSNIQNILKEKGKLIISTPNKENLYIKSSKANNPFHFKDYDLDELIDVLSKYYISKNIEILGYFASDRVYKYLLERKASEEAVRNITSFDKFNIRKLIPKRVRNIIQSVIRKSKNKVEEKASSLGEQITMEDYTFSNNDLNNAQDFIVICTK